MHYKCKRKIYNSSIIIILVFYPVFFNLKHFHVPMYTSISLSSPNPLPSISISYPPSTIVVVEIAVIYNSTLVIHIPVAYPVDERILVLYSP